jgi:hypothetical protein
MRSPMIGRFCDLAALQGGERPATRSQKGQTSGT